MAEPVPALSEQLLHHFHQEKLALLSTIDADTGAPSTNAISWVTAVSPSRVRIALDQRSRLVGNLQANPNATLTVFAHGSVYAVSGQAQTVAEALDGVPFKLACLELQVDAVRDVMFYGARLSVEPEYEKTYDARAAAKLDSQVFAAMKKA